MKTTLIVGTNRLTANLPCTDINEMICIFFRRIEEQTEETKTVCEYEDAEALECDNVYPISEHEPDELPVFIPPVRSVATPIQRTRLFVFKCPDCSQGFVTRKPEDFGTPPNTDISCNCGVKTEVRSMTKASGECPNCGERFWDMYMVNGLSEIICRKCQSPIDLFKQGDGTLGTKV